MDMKYIMIIALFTLIIVCGMGIGQDLDFIIPQAAIHSQKWYLLDVGQYIFTAVMFTIVGVLYFKKETGTSANIPHTDKKEKSINL
jgi:hypothetical protein